MRRLALATCLASASFVAVPVVGAAPCTPLLVDPEGDTSPLGLGTAGYVVEDGRVADLRSVDLRSDRRALNVLVRVVGRSAEGAPDQLDHRWTVSFSTATERFEVSVQQTRLHGTRFALYRVVAGNDVPEDEDAGASAGAPVEAVVTGTVDDEAGVIRAQVPLSAFAGLGGLGTELTRVRTIAWSGASVDVDAAWGSTDSGSTQKRYKVGSRGCQ